MANLGTRTSDRPADPDFVHPRAVPTRVDGALAHAKKHPRVQAAIHIEPGDSVGGYEIIRPLGRGGMGAVYLARDPRLGRRVAIKLMVNAGTELAQRLLVEARATARCRHENIVVIYEVGEFEGFPFLVLEHLEGSSLKAALMRGPMSPERAVEICVPIVEALEHAHSLGIVHRDLTPGNVFLTDSGAVKVLDFGLAKAIDASDRRTFSPGEARRSSLPPALAETVNVSLTQTGVAVGTLFYMSPEQLRGEDVDGRADIWSLGVLLHELATGMHPRGPDLKAAQFLALAAPTTTMPTLEEYATRLPEDVAQIVARCCAHDRNNRYEDVRELLAELKELTAARARAALGEDECPYPGLSTFQEGRSEVFFGRAADARRAQARLRDHPLVALAGPSGVGKSSLVHAGLVPALHRSGERWTVLRSRPGRSPLNSCANLLAEMSSDALNTEEIATLATRLRREPGTLGAALRDFARRGSCQVLLVIDQLEELYTLDVPLEERLAYTAALRAVADDVASPLRIVTTIRSDFVHRVAEDALFMELVTGGMMLVAPLGRADLRAALEQPAALAGYSFEEEIIEPMLNALADTPGPLPLLQFTAARLWDGRNRSKRLITASSYRELGGIEGALSSHADAVFAELPADVRDEARSILLRLVTADRTRAIATMDELVEQSSYPERAQALIEALVKARILVAQTDAASTTVEVAHEALITNWSRLASWIDSEREDIVFTSQLRDAAKQWDERGRPDGLLWRDDALVEAKRWRARYSSMRLAPKEEQFLDAAVQSDARARRRRRRGLGALITGLGLVAAGAVLALVLIGNAEREARELAETARDEAQRALTAERDASESLSRAEREAAQRLRAERLAEASAAEVAERDEDLTASNQQLQTALGEQQRAATRAQSARDVARREADRAQEAERRLRGLLEERNQRVRALEQRLSKISTELR